MLDPFVPGLSWPSAGIRHSHVPTPPAVVRVGSPAIIFSPGGSGAMGGLLLKYGQLPVL